MNVKLPYRGWSDGTHASINISPDREYLSIVPVRYRRTQHAILAGRYRVHILGVHHLGWIIICMPSGSIHYVTHELLTPETADDMCPGCGIGGAA